MKLQHTFTCSSHEVLYRDLNKQRKTLEMLLVCMTLQHLACKERCKKCGSDNTVRLCKSLPAFCCVAADKAGAAKYAVKNVTLRSHYILVKAY